MEAIMNYYLASLAAGGLMVAVNGKAVKNARIVKKINN
jgi:hypothetical protein